MDVSDMTGSASLGDASLMEIEIVAEDGSISTVKALAIKLKYPERSDVQICLKGESEEVPGRYSMTTGVDRLASFLIAPCAANVVNFDVRLVELGG